MPGERIMMVEMVTDFFVRRHPALLMRVRRPSRDAGKRCSQGCGAPLRAYAQPSAYEHFFPENASPHAVLPSPPLFLPPSPYIQLDFTGSHRGLSLFQRINILFGGRTRSCPTCGLPRMYEHYLTSLPFFYHVACRQSYTNLIYLQQQKYFIIPYNYTLLFIITLKYYKNICIYHNYIYFIYNYNLFFCFYLYKNINFDSYILFHIEIT